MQIALNTQIMKQWIRHLTQKTRIKWTQAKQEKSDSKEENRFKNWKIVELVNSRAGSLPGWEDIN